jgi:hypothetical protein
MSTTVGDDDNQQDGRHGNESQQVDEPIPISPSRQELLPSQDDGLYVEENQSPSGSPPTMSMTVGNDDNQQDGHPMPVPQPPRPTVDELIADRSLLVRVMLLVCHEDD